MHTREHVHTPAYAQAKPKMHHRSQRNVQNVLVNKLEKWHIVSPTVKRQRAKEEMLVGIMPVS